ncbi:sugar MFS transporter [Phenylobacterium sp.]|uniref:sugar MFS transporter n=1 Tax=Phenylobacterium sp. TaxID=1871053 RepID=UPI001205FBE9|nr:sugar MFS transporter [Phenylobacterium sp.]THD61004.1 MAG: glucose/galactose MFS transporter [Phenylobacterium sp.]
MTVAAAAPAGRADSPVRSIAIAGGLYFIIGFFTWLNGPLITFVRLAFDLNEVNSFLVLMVFYVSYFVLALPASWILRRTGLKRGLSLSLAVMAVGAAMFGEFATRRWYPGALTGLFVIGGGLALLQTAINPYVSILGPIDGAARRIALMGICNKAAGILAPLVIGALVMHGIGDLSASLEHATGAEREALLNGFAAKIHLPYLAMAVVLLAAAAGILRSPLPDLRASDANAAALAGETEGRSVFSFPHLWLGVICLFVYVGVEVMAGDAIGAYGRAFGLPLDQTKFFTAFTLAAMLAGYLAGLVFTPRIVSQAAYLRASAVMGLVLVGGAFLTKGYVSVGFVAALGFANAMMWPAIFPLAIRGLGKATETGSALLVMGIVGGAIIPQAFAVLKQHLDFQAVFAGLMAPCYLYILYYAWRGYRAPAAVPRRA